MGCRFLFQKPVEWGRRRRLAIARREDQFAFMSLNAANPRTLNVPVADLLSNPTI
jgi:hypothetical protein